MSHRHHPVEGLPLGVLETRKTVAGTGEGGALIAKRRPMEVASIPGHLDRGAMMSLRMSLMEETDVRRQAPEMKAVAFTELPVEDQEIAGQTMKRREQGGLLECQQGNYRLEVR